MRPSLLCIRTMIALSILFVGGLMSSGVCEAGLQDGLEGGNTIGGPGVFIANNGDSQQVFNTDMPQPMCLTLTGEVGTTEASFDGFATLQVAAGHTQAVCRNDKERIDLTCLEGSQCRTNWRVDTPAGEDEIQVNNVVNAPAGPTGLQGPEGPAGPQGPAGSIENLAMDVVPVLGDSLALKKELQTITVSCPVNRFVISGGYITDAERDFVTHRFEIEPANNRALFIVSNNCGEGFCLARNFVPIAYCAKFQ